MDCPKCTGAMVEETYGENIHIHRCNICAGLWVKPDALERMKSTWMAEAALDTGSPIVGSNLNTIDDINCPEGHGKMAKCEDKDQRHIWYEECLTCHGVFLDAGEFTDLKFETPLDKIRTLFTGKRPT